MQGPTIHLGGTSANTLIDGYRAALGALRDAHNELRQIWPNGRDYPAGGFDKALAEHRARIESVGGIINEIQNLWSGVNVQTEAARKARDAGTPGAPWTVQTRNGWGWELESGGRVSNPICSRALAQRIADGLNAGLDMAEALREAGATDDGDGKIVAA